jgi:hypothetical protein
MPFNSSQHLINRLYPHQLIVGQEGQTAITDTLKVITNIGNLANKGGSVYVVFSNKRQWFESEIDWKNFNISSEDPNSSASSILLTKVLRPNIENVFHFFHLSRTISSTRSNSISAWYIIHFHTVIWKWHHFTNHKISTGNNFCASKKAKLVSLKNSWYFKIAFISENILYFDRFFSFVFFSRFLDVSSWRRSCQ